MTNKSVKDISAVLKNILDKYNLSDAVEKEQIFTNWNKLVGKDIARMCKPVKFENNELTLEVKNTVWREELATRQNDLLNLLNVRIKALRIKKIILI